MEKTDGKSIQSPENQPVKHFTTLWYSEDEPKTECLRWLP